MQDALLILASAADATVAAVVDAGGSKSSQPERGPAGEGRHVEEIKTVVETAAVSANGRSSTSSAVWSHRTGTSCKVDVQCSTQ